jgi:hypothetical protein
LKKIKNGVSQFSLSPGQIINPQPRECQAVVANNPLQISFPFFLIPRALNASCDLCINIFIWGSSSYRIYQDPSFLLSDFVFQNLHSRNILHEIRKRKANWIGHILPRNCLLKQVVEGKIKGEMEVTRRRRRRRKKLLNELKDRRGYSHLKEEALGCTMWGNRFGAGFGPVVRQNTE